MTGLLLGAHVDQNDPIAEAQARQARAAQFFLGAPQDWKEPTVAYPGGAEALKSAAVEADVTLYVHAPYRINVATTNNRIRIPSRKLLQSFVNATASIGAAGIVVHGGHVSAEDDPAVGFDNWRKCIERMEMPATVLIENTAGGDNAMARQLDRIARLWEAVTSVPGGDEVGFCLDTCHFHASGEELIGLVGRVKAITGRVDLVHANDSRDAFGSGADRHTNLGQGEIDPDGLVAVVRDAGVPAIVETGGGVEGQTADLEWLRTRLDA